METTATALDLSKFRGEIESNLRDVKIHLSMGTNELARNSHHPTVLYSAIRSDNETVVKLILEKIKEIHGNVSPYINVKNAEGDSPLMWTAKCCYANSAKILLDYGADTEAKNSNGMTALHFASKNNHMEVLRLLIEKGANINAKDKNGLTPSDVAKKESHQEIAGYLAFSVAEMFRKQGKYDEALQTYQEALDIQEVVLGPENHDVLMTRHNMAVVLANQGKHNEALKIYQEVFEILKRKDIFGPDHPNTLTTLYNIAVALSDKGDNSEVLKIFLDKLIKRTELGIHPPNTLTNSDIKLMQKKKNFVKTNLLEEKHNKAKTSIPKYDNLEAIKMGVREHLADRCRDVAILRGKDRDREAWHYVFVDQGKKEKILEQSKKSFINAANYAKPVFSGWGKNPPKNIKDKIDDFLKTVSDDLFVIKEECTYMRVYHYVLIDHDKRKLFLERPKGITALVKKVKNCGRVLYSALGEDPPEVITDRIIESYFSTTEGSVIKINANLSVRSANANGWTKLHNAAYFGNLEVAKCLISDGVDLHAKDTICGRMPVHIAAREGNTDVIQLFLDQRVKINDADEKNWTLLHYATWGGHLNTVAFLIEKGANIHAREATHGKKPIHIAAERGYINIVSSFLRSDMSVDDTDEEGHTALYYAAWRGHLEIVLYLADKYANIHAENIKGIKPIHIATSSGFQDIIQFILDHGADVNDSTKNNFTLLHNAAAMGYLGITELLIKKGAKIDARNDNGKTPSDLARENGHIEVAFLLDFLNLQI